MLETPGLTTEECVLEHLANSKRRHGGKAESAPINLLGGHRWPGTPRVDAGVLATVLHKEACKLSCVTLSTRTKRGR